ncbi:MAG: c-type cytochrome biogenesis protein CcsB [Deltaproteobacteria bacterium]|jgi:cytochrome c-type biogenesis protein CcsB|nr:c-type cytochrome biogenesis protein CcsB [Deltaproteobacteria bacterium]
MWNVRLFDFTTLLFGVASVNYVVALYGKRETIARIGTWICIAAAVVSTAAIGVRWAESYKMGIGRIPVTNLYESLVFFAWSVNLFYLLVEWKYRNRTLGAFVIPIAFGTMLFAFTNESSIQPLVPALQSYWLHAHVITCFVGYAAFAVSAGVAVMYLMKAKREERKVTGGVAALFPSTKILDDLIYKSIIWGFPFLTAGIITGAAWANYAWGTYWSWDPKETWSLIVWLVYAAFLHARVTRGWHGRRAAILSIVGFLATIFCYLGVNLVLSGLHSYGGG